MQGWTNRRDDCCLLLKRSANSRQQIACLIDSTIELVALAVHLTGSTGYFTLARLALHMKGLGKPRAKSPETRKRIVQKAWSTTLP